MNTKLIAIDVETTGLDWTRCGMTGIGFYSKDQKIIGFSKELPDLTGYETIFHNGSFDQKILRKAGITVPYNHDTILMASLLQYADHVSNSQYGELDGRKLEESLALDSCAIRELGIKGDWKIDWKKEHPSYERIKEHCLMDCRVTYYLFEAYKEKLIKYSLWNYYNNLLMPLQRMLVDVECTGIRLDINKLVNMKADLRLKLDQWDTDFQSNNKEILDIIVRQLKDDKISKVKEGKKPETRLNRIKKIEECALEFNINSHVHMSKLLDLKGISLVDKFGEPTTASKLLFKYAHSDPVIAQIVNYKKDNKIYRDFLCKWDEMRIDETLHTNFRLWATRTGRLSSAEPNLQQVPKGSDIRSLFIPREGMAFTVADAKQLEARLAAFFSKEQDLIDIFRNDVDVYSQIAKDLVGLSCKVEDVKEQFPKERALGKQLFLATLYGQGSNSLHYILTKEHGVDITLEECRQYKRKFNLMYRNLTKFSDKCKEEAERNGYINTWFGRKIFIPRDQGYKAINSYIQGSGSDLIGFSQLNIVPKLEGKAKLLLLVHDEIVYEHLPEDTQLVVDTIKKYMVQSIQEKYGIPIDMDIKTGNNWGIK